MYHRPPTRVRFQSRFLADGDVPITDPTDDSEADREIEQDVAQNGPSYAVGPPAAGAFLGDQNADALISPVAQAAQSPQDTDADLIAQNNQKPSAQSDLSPQPSGPDPNDPFFKRDQLWQQYPTVGKPKWYADLAARGAGALAGWSNAASRTRNPIDIGALQEGIKHPQYNEQMQSWQSKMTPVQAQIQQIMGQREAGAKIADIQSQIGQRQGMGKQARARANYYNARAGDNRDWKIDAKTGNLYNQATGKVVPLDPNSNKAKIYSDVLKATGSKDAAMFAVSGYKAPVPQKDIVPIGAGGLYDRTTDSVIARPPDPYRADAEADRRAAMADRQLNHSDEIDKIKKDSDAATITKMNAAILARQNGQPGPNLDKEVSNLRKAASVELQANQNAYEDAIKRHGGTAEHYVVDPNDPTKYTKVGAAIPAALPPQRSGRPPLSSFFGNR